MRKDGAPATSTESPDRGQSSLIGVVLIVSITVMGVTSLMFFGASAISDAKVRAEVDAAEHAMTQFDSQGSLVALGSSDRQQVTIPLDGRDDGLTVDETSGWMNVSISSGTSGTVEIMNVSMGELVYENGDDKIAYQGGGVWRKEEGGGSVMVSPPEFHYRTSPGQDPTLTLPLVTIDGSGPVNERLSLTRKDTVEKYPTLNDPDLANPLTEGQVNITVGSQYYLAWGRFFEERAGGTVHYDHAGERVTITLLVPTSQEPVQGGIVSGVSGGVLELDSNFELDSYNSSEGTSLLSNGVIVTAGSVQMDSNSRIKGTLKTAGTVNMDANAEITGDLYYGSPPTMHGNSEVQGDLYNDPPEVDISPVGGQIDSKLSALKENNNSDSVSAIDDDKLLGCDSGSGCELPSGEYYLEEINLDNNDHLILDNSGGDITIAVEDEMTLDTNDGITVTDENGGTVRIYLGSESNEAFTMNSNSDVTVPGKKSPLLWIYGRPGIGVQFDSNSNFVGVVYAPSTSGDVGSISCDSNGEIYGGLVGNVDQIDSNCQVHFDEALLEESAIPGGSPSLARITYLHISVVDVEVTDG